MGKGWVLGGGRGVGAKVDLDVISVTMEVQVECADDVAEREQVADEEQGAKDGALGDALGDR